MPKTGQKKQNPHFASYEWDKAKWRSNLTKHKIDFVDAQHVFESFHITLPSPHKGEKRYIAIGEIAGNKAIAVVFTKREKGSVCRIISARRARKNEEKIYREKSGHH